MRIEKREKAESRKQKAAKAALVLTAFCFLPSVLLNRLTAPLLCYKSEESKRSGDVVVHFEHRETFALTERFWQSFHPFGRRIRFAGTSATSDNIEHEKSHFR